jgi:hypothetical protein
LNGCPTIVIDGGAIPWITAAAEAIAAAVPDAHRSTLHGQPHNVDAKAIAPALTELLNTGARLHTKDRPEGRCRRSQKTPLHAGGGASGLPSRLTESNR